MRSPALLAITPLPCRLCCARRLRGFWGLSVYPSEMVDPHIHGCPEPEVLAAYVDRGLSLTERGRVDAHLASCPQCIALIAGVARTVVEVSAHVPDAVVAAEATPLVTRRSLAGALAAAAAVIAVLAAPSVMRPWLEREHGSRSRHRTCQGTTCHERSGLRGNNGVRHER